MQIGSAAPTIDASHMSDIFLSSSLILWSSKKQPTLSQLSNKAEYRFVASTIAELCWIKNNIRDLGLFHRQPATLYCDNVSVAYLYVNPVFYRRMKHLDIDFHDVRE